MLSILFFTVSTFMLMGIPILAVICGVWCLCKACSQDKYLTGQTLNSRR